MPKWLEDACFYEIYPQSFNDTNADGIGDFQGIIDKLDYIKELGCNAIWMNPCFLSPFHDAGYDVQDYYKVAPRYGTNEDLVRLFEEAHKREMHVLLDLVPGHTAIEHPWFQASMQGTRNEFTDRYVWTDNVWNIPKEGNWLSGISDRDGAAYLNFFCTQPALNYGFLNPTEPWQQPVTAPGPMASKEEMKNVIRFWLSAGADGFRVDMAHSMIKNDDEQSSGTVAFWQEFRAFMDEEFPDCALLSEWGEPDKSLAGGFHMDFLLHFGPSHYNDLFRCEHPYFSREGKGEKAEFIARYVANYEKAGGEGLICIPSGNHDMDRMARYQDQEEMKISFAFLLSVPGAPFIYYGDEIGMRYVEGLISKEGGFSRTGSRTPMQWNSKVNAGFSSAPAAELYIPQDSDVKGRPTVEKQMADKTSLWHEIQKLIAIRKNHPALLNTASIQFLDTPGYPMVYLRSCESEQILVAINPAGASAEIDLRSALSAEQLIKLGSAQIIYSYTEKEDDGGNCSTCPTPCQKVKPESTILDGVLVIPGASSVFIKL